MMQAIMNKAASWIVRILAVLLILSFAAWGIGDMITGGGLPTDVAEIGDVKITARQFNRAFRREMDRMRAVFGPQLDSDQARQLGADAAALGGLIQRQLLALAGADLGLEVGDNQIRQQIQQEAAFRNSLGQFDQQAFQSAIAQQGYSEASYVEELRRQILRSHLIGVIASGATVPSRLADLVYRHRNQKRIAVVVEIPRASMAEMGAPDEVALRQYHSANAAEFTAPELRDVTAISLSPEDLAAEIKPSEERIRDEYESRLASLSVPERRLLSQVLTADEATAKRVAEALRQGRPLADAAKDIAGQDEAATRLGKVRFADLPRELAEVAFKLGENSPSDPVQTPLGWHVLLVEKIEAGKTPSFEDVRATLTAELGREMAVDALVGLANQVEDTLAGGAALEEAASQLNVRLIRLRGIDGSGRDVTGTRAKDLPSGRAFLETAFATEEGQTGNLVDTADGGYFILRVDRIEAPTLRPFDTVRHKVVAAWKRARRDDASRDQAKKLVARVEGGETLATAAAHFGMKVTASKPFTRFDGAARPLVSAALSAELFKVKMGATVMAPTANGYAVGRVKDIQPAYPAADKKGFDEVRDGLRAGISADVLSQYGAALRRRHPVSVDQGALDRLFNEGGVSRF